PTIEADETQSSSSSSLSFENNNESVSCYSQFYSLSHPPQEDLSFNHFMMEDNMKSSHHQASNDLTYQPSDWSISHKSSSSTTAQLGMHRDDVYPTLPPPAYWNEPMHPYSDLPQIKQIHHASEDMYHLNWFHPMTAPNQIPAMQPMGTVKMEDDSNKLSCDTVMRKKHTPQFLPSSSSHTMPILPPQPPMHFYRPTHSFVMKREDRFHPRYKSAHARLPPYSEQPKEVYQHFLSPPLLSNQPSLDQGDLVLEEELDSKKVDFDPEKKDNPTSFQFDIVLHAPTAIIKKHDEQTVTYLNRGQAYLIDLVAKSTASSGTLTSTISIAFHESSHRQIAENYWKYWISQQENHTEARAIDLDDNQTTGVYNVRLVSFDRIAFDWYARFGAKVYVRFNCLSTDFSRIKGVKGIPMRAVVETVAPRVFEKLAPTEESYEYKERCYCKIKLFRDKGAERKNKDDKKQMAKQMEKIVASTNGNPEQHPLWSIVSQSHQPTSCFDQVPTSPDITLDDLDNLSEILVSADKMVPPLLNPTTQTVSTKRKRSSSEQEGRHVKHKPLLSNTKPPFVLSFYVWSRHFQGTPKEVFLESFTAQDLKIKLANVLFIHPNRISEILWRKKRPTQDTSEVLVLVEDTFVSEHILDGEMMTVDWEMKTDGNLRLVLEF
ncbi:grainyhead-like, partial [Rhizopus stolonifer]